MHQSHSTIHPNTVAQPTAHTIHLSIYLQAELDGLTALTLTLTLSLTLTLTQAELDGLTARNAVLHSTRAEGRVQLLTADAQLASLEIDLAAAQAATPCVRGAATPMR